MERGRQEKQEIVQKMVRTHSAEKEFLESKINGLKKSLVQAEGNYIEAKDKLNYQEAEKYQLQLKAKVLETDIKDIQKTSQIKEEVYKSQLETKERVLKNQISTVQ